MIYQIENNIKNLRILGKEFVKNNKNKGKLILNNKKVSLKDKISAKDINNNKILMILNESVNNRSYIFKDCELLVSLESLINLSIDNHPEILTIEENLTQKVDNNYNVNEGQEESTIYSFKDFSAIIDDKKYNFYNQESYLEISNKKSYEYSDSLITASNFNNSLPNELFGEISKLTDNISDNNKLFDNNKSLLNFNDLIMFNTTNSINTDSNNFLSTFDETSILDITSFTNIS